MLPRLGPAHCDCGCVIHARAPRTRYTDADCCCRLTCGSQPASLLIPDWGLPRYAMFVDAAGALITVAIDTDGQPDWSTAGEIHYTHALAAVRPVLAHLLEAVALLTPPARSRMATADAWLIRGLIDVIATQVRHGEDLEHGDAAPHRQLDASRGLCPSNCPLRRYNRLAPSCRCRLGCILHGEALVSGRQVWVPDGSVLHGLGTTVDGQIDWDSHRTVLISPPPSPLRDELTAALTALSTLHHRLLPRPAPLDQVIGHLHQALTEQLRQR